jgi:hypothetical protein
MHRVTEYTSKALKRVQQLKSEACIYLKCSDKKVTIFEHLTQF